GPAPPVHTRAHHRGPEARSARPDHARDPEGRGPEPGARADGLPVPPAMPRGRVGTGPRARDGGALPRRGPDAPRTGSRTRGGLPPRLAGRIRPGRAGGADPTGESTAARRPRSPRARP